MYGKLFQSTYTGSMVGSGAVVFAVWGYVIANCRDSIIELNAPLLAASIGCTTAEIEAAIEYLCKPDPNSRNSKEEGRRLIKLSAFSYHVTTYSEYQNIRDDEDRREYFRNYMRKYRASNDVNVNVKPGKPPSTHLDSDLDLEAEEQRKKKARSALVLPEWLPSETWKAWCDYRNTRKGWTAKAKELSLRTLTKLHGQGFDPAAVIEKSIECGWTGLFPLGGNNANGSRNRKLSAVEQVEQAIRERREREAAGGIPFAGSNGSLVDEDGKPVRSHLG